MFKRPSLIAFKRQKNLRENLIKAKVPDSGETKQMLKKKLDYHRGSVTKGVDNATWSHFNQPSHSLADLRVTIIEQVKKQCILYRKEREEYFLRKLYTDHEGINKNI